MRRLIIIAPNDRYNYGDLIFSHIVKFKLRKYYDEIIDVATVANDLRAVGGDIVKPLNYIYELPQEDINDIIVAGGESLCSNWGICISYLSSKYSFLPLLERVLNKMFNKSKVDLIKNSIGRILFNGKTYYPYTIGKCELHNVNRIFYNSLGGATLSKGNFTNSTVEILKSVDYISVRDENSFRLLKDNGINANLCPDSAILMSECFSLDYLKTIVSFSVLDYVEKCQNRIVFQINKSIGLRDLTEICDLLKKAYLTTGFNVCLCPVGFALGHEDHIALKAIYNKINSGCVVLFEKLSIWEIMYLIGSSKLFVGSSLHGVITAMSYNIPYIGVKVPKTHKYIMEWGNGNASCLANDFKCLESITNLLGKKEVQFSVSQKKMIDSSFDIIREIICN